jgi:Zn-dependent peptidase ImmA (M78 family)/DNA-binding XRE family transcriptional regulator
MTESQDSRVEISGRIAQARDDAGMTQAQLAAAIGLDRTAVAKIETGVRKVSATELVGISAALDRPIDWFVLESPPGVISRRQDPIVGGHSQPLDRSVELLGRDAAFLLEQGVLTAESRRRFEMPQDFAAAEQLAAEARRLMGVENGPLLNLQASCEGTGLLAFSLELGPTGGDAAYVEVDDLGVALINGSLDPGRRRFNLAHEFGHHLVGDAYAPEIAVVARDETERFLNAFAVYLLMPREAVRKAWKQMADWDRRLAAVAVSVRFRTSWTATCSHLRNLQLIDDQEMEELTSAPPRKGDFFELGEWWVPELESPSVPPEYGRRVVRAYRSGKLTASRTVELLWDTVTETDLPALEAIPLEGVRREFEPLQ